MKTLESQEFLGIVLMEWLIALGYIVGSVIFARILYRIFKGRIKKLTEATDTEIEKMGTTLRESESDQMMDWIG